MHCLEWIWSKKIKKSYIFRASKVPQANIAHLLVEHTDAEGLLVSLAVQQAEDTRTRETLSPPSRSLWSRVVRISEEARLTLPATVP